MKWLLDKLFRKARIQRRVAQIWVEAAAAEKIVASYNRRSRFRPGTSHGLTRQPILVA